MMRCPSAEQLRRFLAGMGEADERTLLETHLATCAACRTEAESPHPAPAADDFATRLDSAAVAAGDVTNLPAPLDPPEFPGADDPPRAEDERPADRSGGTELRTPASGGGTAEDPPPVADAAAVELPPPAVDPAPGAADPFETRFRGGETPPDEADTKTWHSFERMTVSEGEYELLDELGHGGMGVVYKARQVSLNRPVALKMIRAGEHAHPDHLARFRIEAEAVARLRHPNIVQVYQVGTLGGLPFVALELLEGGALARRLAGTPQPPHEAAALIVILARAMHAAHRAGIVHRDLKPANVLFTADGVPKVTDFGLAKRLEVEDGETQTGQVMGTPSYMAPEQALGQVRRIGPPTDVYALGAILYEALTGRPPFKGATASETVSQVISQDPVPPSRLVARVPRDLETIALMCLQKEPHRRYPEAIALAEDLERYLKGRPIRARRTPPWERSAKWARRHPTAATVLALGLVAAGAGTSVRLHRLAKVQNAVRMESLRIARLREAVERRLFQAHEDQARERFDLVKDNLAQLPEEVGTRPRLADLRARADTLLRRARDGWNAKAAADAAQRRYQSFLTAREKAWIRHAQFTGLDTPVDPSATAEAVRAALDLFGTRGADGSWTLAPMPPALAPRQRDEVVAACRELLHIQAEARLESAEGPAQTRATEALRLLDGAAALGGGPSRAWWLCRAACLDLLEDRDGAGLARAEAAKLEPRTVLDFFLRGQEHYRRRDFAAAIRDFNEALQRQPDHFWSQCLLALCWIQSQPPSPSTARPSLNACLQRSPRSPWLYLLRGLANAQDGTRAQDLASRHSDEAAAQRVEAAAHFDAAEADYRAALDRLAEGKGGDELRYALLVNRGVLRLQRGDADAAAADLDAAIALDDARYEAHSNLALVRRRQGRTAEALAAFERAIARRPGWSPLYRGRAHVRLDQKSLGPEVRAAALADLDAAIRHEGPRNPVLADDHTRRAFLLHQAGRHAGALAAVDEAIAIAPRYAPAHRLRLQVLLDLGRFDDLVGSCDAALASGGPSARLYEIRGLGHDARGQGAAALADYTQALALKADQPRVLIRRGWSYLAGDAPRPALADFDAALRLDPAQADAYLGRGAARARIGRHREAVRDAETALRTGTPTARLAYNAARIYAEAANAAVSGTARDLRTASLLMSRYQDRAVALVAMALERQPDARRGEFWRDTVQTDPALRGLRRRLKPPPAAGAPAP